MYPVKVKGKNIFFVITAVYSSCTIYNEVIVYCQQTDFKKLEN